MLRIKNKLSTPFWLTLSLIALLALLWTAEVAYIQEVCFNPRFVRYFSWIGKHALRWGLAYSVILLLLAILPKKVLVLAMVAHILFSLMLHTYASYFDMPLSEQVILAQTGEGAKFAGYALSLVDMRLVCVLTALLGCKICLLCKVWTGWARFRKKAGIFASALCLVFLCTLSWLMKPSLIATMEGWQSYGEAYGHFPAWCINLIYNGFQEDMLRNAMAGITAINESSLAGSVTFPEKIANICVIQVESLDYAMLDRQRQDGGKVMPFLHSLLTSSLVYEVHPDRRFGTATADFTMSSGLMPAGPRLPYKIKGFPFEEIASLPRMAAKKGFRSAVLHGNYGSFYGRKEAFAAMGYDSVVFYEELARAEIPEFKGYVHDYDLFQFSSEMMKEGKNLHFCITMTSHAPWEMVPDYAESLSADNSDTYGRYVNSLEYVDFALKEYVRSLDDETLFIIYGDHTSGLVYPKSRDTVPCLIYYKGANMRALQKENPPQPETPVRLYEIVYLLFEYFRQTAAP